MPKYQILASSSSALEVLSFEYRLSGWEEVGKSLYTQVETKARDQLEKCAAA